MSNDQKKTIAKTIWVFYIALVYTLIIMLVQQKELITKKNYFFPWSFAQKNE